MTFSIAARCPETGQFGVAVASSSICVASRCAHTHAGVGAVMTQNVTNPALGPRLLALLAGGMTATKALATVAQEEPFMDWRQLVITPETGSPVVHSGQEALGIYGHAIGRDAAAAGNLLANADIPARMIAVFEQHTGTLADRLLAAMAAAVAAGGEAGPIHSAGLKVSGDTSWPIIDLRVDWTENDPIAELQSLWERYAPQMPDYITRAVNPVAAPSYGVPGDL